MMSNATMTVMPRHGSPGIGRSYSRGGPPCTRSAGVGSRKNKRGSRSLLLKLEIDEGIAASLSKNDRARHKCPSRSHDRARQAGHCGFDIAVAQPRVRRDQASGDEHNLQNLASGQNRIGMGVPAKHSPQHSRSDGEIRRSEKNPGDADSAVSGEPGEKSCGEITRPRGVFETNTKDPLDHEIRTVQQTPNDKCPGRPVPQTAEKHNDNEVEGGVQGPDLIAA